MASVFVGLIFVGFYIGISMFLLTDRFILFRFYSGNWRFYWHDTYSFNNNLYAILKFSSRSTNLILHSELVYFNESLMDPILGILYLLDFHCNLIQLIFRCKPSSLVVPFWLVCLPAAFRSLPAAFRPRFLERGLVWVVRRKSWFTDFFVGNVLARI